MNDDSNLTGASAMTTSMEIHEQPVEIYPYLCFSWLQLVVLSFSRAQPGTHLGYFEGIGCWVRRLRDEVIGAGCGILPAEVLDDMSLLCNRQG